MLINTSSNNLITGLPLDQSELVRGVENNQTGTKSPYVTKDVFNDTSEISNEAISLYQKEKDVEKYKNMVMDSPLSDAELKAIMDLIQKGEFIDNKDLTDALSTDKDLMSYLYT
jgi:hypothetical protein